MSTSLSRQTPPRERTLNQAAIGGAAIALGFFTIITLIGQWSSFMTAITAILNQIGKWLGAVAPSDSNTYWYMARSAGIVAYLLLWMSVASGILVSDKIINEWVKPAAVFELHKFASILALIVGAFHGLILLGDTYMNFNLLDIVIPFKSAYQPFWVGLGILGLYLMAILVASFYVKKRIGHRAWKLLHFTSFGVWIMTSLHGIVAGSDTSTMLAKLMYTIAIVSVGYMLTYRIIEAKSKQPASVKAH